VPAAQRISAEARKLTRLFRRPERFAGSRQYWESRYASGANSGGGSYGAVAQYKAGFLNRLVEEYGVYSVLEFGCGDGNQLSLARYGQYTGLDVSRTAVQLCGRRFAEDATKSFLLYDPEAFINRGALAADLTLSLDVILHLVEYKLFELHMQHLFQASLGLVAIFAPDVDRHVAPHVLYRRFTPWISSNQPGWRLVTHEKNTLATEGHDTAAEFFVYQRRR